MGRGAFTSALCTRMRTSTCLLVHTRVCMFMNMSTHGSFSFVWAEVSVYWYACKRTRVFGAHVNLKVIMDTRVVHKC